MTAIRSGSVWLAVVVVLLLHHHQPATAAGGDGKRSATAPGKSIIVRKGRFATFGTVPADKDTHREPAHSLGELLQNSADEHKGFYDNGNGTYVVQPEPEKQDDNESTERQRTPQVPAHNMKQLLARNDKQHSHLKCEGGGTTSVAQRSKRCYGEGCSDQPQSRIRQLPGMPDFTSRGSPQLMPKPDDLHIDSSDTVHSSVVGRTTLGDGSVYKKIFMRIHQNVISFDRQEGYDYDITVINDFDATSRYVLQHHYNAGSLRIETEKSVEGSVSVGPALTDGRVENVVIIPELQHIFHKNSKDNSAFVHSFVVSVTPLSNGAVYKDIVMNVNDVNHPYAFATRSGYNYDLRSPNSRFNYQHFVNSKGTISSVIETNNVASEDEQFYKMY